MEIISPSHPSRPPAAEFLSGFSPPATFRRGFDRTAQMVPDSQLPEIVEDGGGGQVHVAVGKSVDKSFVLLKWAFGKFQNHEICILHVHQPSSFIPTLLGKLPASQANVEVVTAFRYEEREETEKLMFKYLNICSRSKVKASVLTTEASQVQEGIVDLVNEHSIRKLVIGAFPDCMKVKKISRKASYTANNVPSFCKIWFVSKGKLFWTRPTSDVSSSISPVSQPVIVTSPNLRSRSLKTDTSENIFPPESLRSSSARITHYPGMKSWVQDEVVHTEVGSLSSVPSSERGCHSHSRSSSSFSSRCGHNSFAEQNMSTQSYPKIERENIQEELAEAEMEAEKSKNEASAEFLECKRLEAAATEAISKVKCFESAHAREVQLKKEIEDELGSIIEEQKKLLEEREKMTYELQRAMRNIALLDNRAQESNRRCEEIGGELKLIQASISTMRQEKRKIQQQKMEAIRWLDCWKKNGSARDANVDGFYGFVDGTELVEFSCSDLQTATCDFSKDFMIGQGGHGDVYKGEMLHKTVAIKKFHPHDMRRQSEFLKEVHVLGRIRHPHVVKLIGICPEAWSLIYEYLPGGNLHDRLFSRNNVSSLGWKIRARVIAEIASGLLFLHSSDPQKIVHGNLKPENILLGFDNNTSKICDFGIHRLAQEQALRCPSFGRHSEQKGAFSYSDPEFLRTGLLTPKSDVYSFGLIILQLITGRTPVGLISEVRKAVRFGKLASILDSSAGEWSMFVARRLADLALQFSESDSRDRPELTQALVRELDRLPVLEEEPVPHFFLCPIMKEIMHDPQVAADGFTYEGDALREWLESGHGTSPMTNLKFSHLDLTPNHALRLAIQDWLCKSQSNPTITYS